MSVRRGLLPCVFLLCALPLLAQTPVELLNKASEMLKKGKVEEAGKLFNQVIEKDDKNAQAYFLRGEFYSAQRKYTEAIKDFDKALALDKDFVVAVDRRGDERFKLGLIKESIEDFDTFIKARPKAEEAHWRRGISYYYAGRFAEGAKQFKLGEVVFGADAENAFWHYLCNVRIEGIAKSRKQILKIGVDRRIPFMKIYDLILGKAKPDEVITTAEKADLKGEDRQEALFYAHLYVGLNYEAEGNAAKCKEHLQIGVEKHKISHYMWDVGNVHLQLLTKKK